MMRYGFTTGSCAAAASKAAIYMLLSGCEKNRITIDTPKGIPYEAEILDIKRSCDEVSCAVKKDGGDDPDVTSGLLIYSSVKIDKSSEGKVIIEGGEGVGKVTKPGLDQKVGEYAINSVPRLMIEKEVREICDLFDMNDSVKVTISVSGGEEIAQKTFNPKLGIEGGISIIGTGGIVEPMSTQALLDTIKIELRQRKETGFDYVAISPGNYGIDFMKNSYGYDLDKSVKCSNFIGCTIDMACELGFKEVLYVGHIGKLIKVAGGIMNTHSKEADCRMEITSALAIKHDVETELIKQVLECVTMEEACKILKQSDKFEIIMKEAAEKVRKNLISRSGGKLDVGCIMFSKELGELAKSDNSERLIRKLINEKNNID